MKITEHNLTFTLTIKEVETWMTAVRQATLNQNNVRIVPRDACPFFKQHGELVRLTGYGAHDHEEMKRVLAARSSK
jgi:hypothetical protein